MTPALASRRSLASLDPWTARSVDGSEVTPITDHGSVALRGGSIFKRMLSWVLLLAALVFLALLAVYILASLGIIHLGFIR